VPRIRTLNISNDTGVEEYQQGEILRLSEEINTALDEAFQSPVSIAAFAGASPLSPIANGNLLFMNFLNALTPLIEKSIKNFTEARKKYTEAAKHSMGKSRKDGIPRVAEGSDVT
jgi:ABC-type proline/glycine betaine transport system permease subunit